IFVNQRYHSTMIAPYITTLSHFRHLPSITVPPYSMALHYVFVYGTLKSSESNHAVLTGSEGKQRFLGLAETVSAFPLVVGTHLNIPFLLYQRDAGLKVEGEIYEVDDAKLAVLDKLEKHPVFYQRKLEKVVIMHCNEVVEAWVYAIPKWADDFIEKKSSGPIAIYRNGGADIGRPLLNNRARETITPEEGKQLYIDILGHFPDDIPQMIRVFVYGTLKQGEPNHSVMTSTEGWSRFRGAARSVTSFPLVVGTQFNIPFVLDKRGEGNEIHGELYEVDEKKLATLDALEAHPVLYERKLEEFIMEETGVKTEAWIYIIHKWKDDFLTTCSGHIASYSTAGDHGRPYLDRYVREKLMKDEETNLFMEIMGVDPREDGCTIGVGKKP
ncbi:hypothetical protein PFISCL1PPCAC_9251, partial [Pristionchus fissidentatus]